VLNLKILWNDAESAARLANAVASVFVDRSLQIRVDEAQEDLDRYTVQLRDARVRVQRADAAVLAFQQTHQVSDFDEETKARLIDLSRLEAEHRTVLAQVDGLLTASEELEAAVAEQPETVVSSTLYRNPLKKRLEEFRWQLKEARSRYTRTNPKVIKLEREISALEGVLQDSGEQSAPERTDGPNQLRQDMQLHLHELNDEIRKEQGRASGLATSVQSTLAKLAYLSAREKEYAALKANQDAARQLESSLAAKAEEARVAASSGEAAFQVLESASTPVDPAPSGRKLMVAAGAVFGLGLGLFLALLLEIIDPVIRDRADLTSLVDGAVTMGFPAIERINPHVVMDRFAQRWRRLVNDLEARGGRSALAIISLTAEEPRPVAAWNIAVTYATKGTEAVLAAGQDGDADFPESRPPLLSQIAGPLSNIGTSATAEEVESWLERAVLDVGRTVVEVPPLCDDETAMELAAMIGAVVLVTTSGVTDRRTAEETIARLRSQGAEVIGAIVTNLPPLRQDDARPFTLTGRTALPIWRSAGTGPSEVQHA
jgi:Mrp family chromosome partitioning ATPase